MERTREQLLILTARVVQITMGMTIMIWCIVLTSAVYDYSQILIYITLGFGGVIALIGTAGFFSLSRHVHDIQDTRLYMLILYLDVWAASFSLAAVVCASVCSSYYDRWSGGKVLMAGPAVAALIALGAFIPLIVRTSRLWWKRMLHGMPPEDDVALKQYPASYYAAQSVAPTIKDDTASYIATPSGPATNYEALILQAADEIRSITSSRPFSLAETTNATLNPNLMSAGATLRSQPAPSYTTRMDMGSRLHK